jgi:hypothetical protein
VERFFYLYPGHRLSRTWLHVRLVRLFARDGVLVLQSGFYPPRTAATTPPRRQHQSENAKRSIPRPTSEISVARLESPVFMALPLHFHTSRALTTTLHTTITTTTQSIAPAKTKRLASAGNRTRG